LSRQGHIDPTRHVAIAATVRTEGQVQRAAAHQRVKEDGRTLPGRGANPEQFEKAWAALPGLYLDGLVMMHSQIIAGAKTPYRAIRLLEQWSTITHSDNSAQPQRRLAGAHGRTAMIERRG
jgi:hypothetical protein